MTHTSYRNKNVKVERNFVGIIVFQNAYCENQKKKIDAEKDSSKFNFSVRILYYILFKMKEPLKIIMYKFLNFEIRRYYNILNY